MARRRYPCGSTTARYPGVCARCGEKYQRGEQIARVVPGWGHVTCRSVTDPGPGTGDGTRGRVRGESRATQDRELHRKITDALGGPEPYD